jgi:hypothetical protein
MFNQNECPQQSVNQSTIWFLNGSKIYKTVPKSDIKRRTITIKMLKWLNKNELTALTPKDWLEAKEQNWSK